MDFWTVAAEVGRHGASAAGRAVLITPLIFYALHAPDVVYENDILRGQEITHHQDDVHVSATVTPLYGMGRLALPVAVTATATIILIG